MRIWGGFFGLIAAAALPSLVSAAEPAPDIVVMRAIDKVTARTTTLEVPIGGAPVTFGTLSVSAKTCRKAPPEELPESEAFIEINETIHAPGGDSVILRFSGWMFASNPGLSGLEHPIYDVWVVDCKNSSSASSPTSP